MKVITKILIAVLALTVLIPLKLGILCLFSQTNALEFFSLLTINPDLEKVFIVLGGFVLASVVLQILTIVWLVKGKAEGFTLSLFVGAITIGRGLLMLIMFSSHNITETRICIAPTIIGILILLLTIFARRKQNIKQLDT